MASLPCVAVEYKCILSILIFMFGLFSFSYQRYNTSKRTKDPNAPKRNISAYLLYQNAMRNTFKAQNPGLTFGQLAKFTSSMYSQITAEEKSSWETRAEADKQRYLQELSVYIPPPGFDAKGDAILAYHPATRISSSDKPAYHSPKKSLPAYMLFQNAMRDQFRRENPAMTFGELSSYTSLRYKELTPEERASWHALAAEDKARYEHEKRFFYNPYAAHEPPPTHKKARNGKKTKAVKVQGAPKRARGAYVFFTNHVRPMIMQQNPSIDFKDMGILMGEKWRSLTQEEKAPFEEMALSDKDRFKEETDMYNAREMTVPTHHPDIHSEPQQYGTDLHMPIHPHEYSQPMHPHDYGQTIHPDDYNQTFNMQSYGAASYDHLNPNNYYYDPYTYPH